MNEVNVQHAINIMLRAKERNSVYMNLYQAGITKIVSTESEFHACGNKACFAGHVAISPEFHADGGSADVAGSPRIERTISAGKSIGESKTFYEEIAIAEWLGISYRLAQLLLFGSFEDDLPYCSRLVYCNFYKKNWRDVNADDVLEKLYAIQRGELE